MASWKFWAKVLGRRYAPSRNKQRPLFMERRLDNLSSADKHGRLTFFEPFIRTIDINVFTDEARRGYYEAYPIQCGLITIPNTVLGQNDLIVQPPVGEIWLYDKGALAHDDTQARVCDIYLIDVPNNLICALHTEGHVDIPNGAIDTPIFPSFHEEAGNTHYHLALGHPLQLDHHHYLRLRGLGFAANHLFYHQFIYRRIK